MANVYATTPATTMIMLDRIHGGGRRPCSWSHLHAGRRSLPMSFPCCCDDCGVVIVAARVVLYRMDVEGEGFVLFLFQIQKSINQSVYTV